jgi:enoyl-CoA hydratase
MNTRTETLAQGRARIVWDPRGVATFTVTRPRVHNALDLETIEALDHFVEQLAQRPEVIVAIFTGAGTGSFIAGGDLQQLARLRGAEAGFAFARRVGEILNRLEDLTQITIAAIGGDAYGGGTEVALACDLRLMAQDAALVFSQARFGLTSGWGGLLRLTRLVGYSRALDMFLTQRRVTTEESLPCGLINRSIPPGEDVLEAAQRMALDILRVGPEVACGLKRIARFSVSSDPEDVLNEERRIFAQLWARPERQAKIQAFLRKQRSNDSED